MSHRLYIATGCGSALMAVVGCMAANAEAIQFNIPSGFGGKSIPEFARQAHVQIIGPGEALQSIITPEVRGTYEVNVALEMMLKGTDLVVSYSAEGTITIARREPEKNQRGEPMLKGAKSSTSIFALLFGTLAAGPAIAQDSTSALETVVVTGTLIRGVAAPVGSNLADIKAVDIAASGATNAIDLLNGTITQLPSFNTLSTGTASWGNPVTKIALRGFGTTAGTSSGATATLILFNGHRVVPMGVLSTDPDPQLIPADIVEAVQVMPDGGSATYGSDAVGGVVNFVTRKNFDGIQVHVNDSIADAYNEFNASVTAGTSWKNGNALISILHDSHNALFGKDRDYDTVNFNTAKNHHGTDYRGTSCTYGTFSVDGGASYYVGSNFANVAQRPVCDPTDNSSLYPKESRISAFGFVEQELTSSLSFSMDAFWSSRKTTTYLDSAAITGSMTITNANPYWHAIGSETSQTVSYDFERAVGANRASPQYFMQYQVAPSLTWNVDGNWQVRAGLIYGKSWATIHDRTGVNSSVLTNTNFNPYDPGLTNSSVLNDLTNYELYSQGINSIQSAQVTVDGALMTLPGGDVHVAVGGEVRRQTLRDSTFTGPIGSRISSTGGIFPAGRTIEAVYAELLIPVVGDQNALPFVKKLSLDAAVRYDHYTDFGDTTNPRIGIDYKPIDDLLIRANFQTTFDAPSLADSGNRVDTRFQILQFAVPNNYLVFIAGSGTGVKPMTGTTFSVGGDWTPHFIDGLKIGTTYWNTTLKNTISLSIGAYGFFGAFSSPYNLCGSGFAVYPASANGACTAAYLNSIQSKWVRIDNGSAPGITGISDLFKPGVNITGVIDARRGNFGAQKMSGLDFDTSYTTDVSFGTVFAQIAGTYYVEKKNASTMGAAYVDYLSGNASASGMPQYNLAISAGGTFGPYTARFSVNHTAGYTLQTGAVAGQADVGSFTVANVYLSANLGELAGVLKENELSFTINNLFDQDPPYYNSTPQVNSNGTTAGFTNGGTLGQMFTIGLRTKF